MKAILLAGGKGTRLRPLTLNTPKPIVPIFDRPFLQYQIDLLRQVPEIDEIVLSLNYQPGRIKEVFGDGEALGVTLSYVVEPNLKEGNGGLRERHTLFWIGKYAYQVESVPELVEKGLMTKAELRQEARLGLQEVGVVGQEAAHRRGVQGAGFEKFAL